jgi:hypothetical protein
VRSEEKIISRKGAKRPRSEERIDFDGCPKPLYLGADFGNIPNPEKKLFAQSFMMSFRPWGEIFLGSLAFSRDDGP